MCVHPYIKEINGILTPLPCGKCIECRKKYTNDWVFRLSKHAFYNPVYWFITLTYNDEHLPTIEKIDFSSGKKYKESCVIVSEVQNFMKRLRKMLNFPKMTYFAVGEYGKNNRAHYHILLFFDGWKNVHQAYLSALRAWSPFNDCSGFVYVRKGVTKHIHYVSKYVNKLDMRHHYAPPFKCMSNGLGLDYLTPSLEKWFWSTGQLRIFYDAGKSIPLPRYYKKKLDERCSINGLSLSQWSTMLNYNPDLSLSNPHSYHEYFCRHYDDIYPAFASWFRIHEDNHYPDLTVNTCFDWFLHTNKLTRDAIYESDRLLQAVRIKGRYEEVFDPLLDNFDEIHYLYYDDI